MCIVSISLSPKKRKICTPEFINESNTNYGFQVSAYGLGAYSYNVGASGAAFGVANNTTLNVYQILLAANKQALNGLLYDGSTTLDDLDNPVFTGINEAGDIS